MPVRREHYPAHFFDIIIRHLRVKEIAHRIHEDFPWGAPTDRITELLWHDAKIEPLFEGMRRNTAKALGERFGVTVLATRTDFRATPDGVPRGIGPFDFGVGAYRLMVFT
jgi:hypothetical protein